MQLPAGDIYSIENMYKSSRSNNRTDMALFYAATRGVIDSAIFTASYINSNKDQEKCITDKDISTWSNFVFDEYKKNNFNGDARYTTALFLIIHEHCHNNK
jgi:hypothetical protein